MGKANLLSILVVLIMLVFGGCSNNTKTQINQATATKEQDKTIVTPNNENESGNKTHTHENKEQAAATKEQDKVKVTPDNKNESSNVVPAYPDKEQFVGIRGYYEPPESLNHKNTIVLDGLLEGEFVEVVVNGEIKDFEHIKLEWDEKTSELVEKECINKFEIIKDKKIVIKTYMPEGIPCEKIKWKSSSGKSYEHIIMQYGLGDDDDVVKFYRIE